jgi:phospholipid/cholesterol/gamma-HCH transport system ATP-binding protein
VAPAPAIVLDRVTKAFGARRVLDEVSFEVAGGTCCCVLGRSGTGKSVTLRHIIGLLAPDDGRVLVENRDLATLAPAALGELRLRMGFLFQHAALFDSITVGENVAFPLRRHTRLAEEEIQERVMTRMAQVGLGGAVRSMPGELSGGMRKRAGLARAMALDPPILLVDEPSAGLDPITSAEIDDLLAFVKGELKTTLVVVTHNIPSAKRLADDLVFLDGGRVIARGSPQVLERSEQPLVRRFLDAAGGNPG